MKSSSEYSIRFNSKKKEAKSDLKEENHMADRKNTGVLKCAILTMSFVQMGTNGIAPILAQIAAEFPSASSSAIQFLMTFPSIFCVIFTMLAALLSNRLPKRILALAGLSIVAAGGILACLFHGSLAILFVWAAFLGIGIGMTAPIAPSLINELFSGAERQTLLGLQNSAANVGSMLMTFLGGFLAAAGWNFGYLVYLLGIPGILFTLKGVPARTVSAKDAGEVRRPPFRLVILPEMLIAFVFLMLFSSGPANLSMLVEERALGGTAVSGVMSTLFLLGGTIAGILYGRIAGKLGEKTIPLGGILLAVGALLISAAGNVFVLSAGCLIAGSSISLVMPSCMGAASRLPGYETLSSAMILSSSNVGVFIMPLLTSATAVITGSGATSYRFVAVALIAAVLAVITALPRRKAS